MIIAYGSDGWSRACDILLWNLKRYPALCAPSAFEFVTRSDHDAYPCSHRKSFVIPSRTASTDGQMKITKNPS